MVLVLELCPCQHPVCGQALGAILLMQWVRAEAAFQ